MKRREALLNLGGLPLVGSFSDNSNIVTKQKILIAGAHPDDPETGAGGAAALWAQQGHEVILAYLTTGEAGIEGISHEESAQIRKKEALTACEILGTKSIFLGQIDGDAVVNNEWYARVKNILENENPDLLLTHWPVDAHRDHRACSLLFYDAWLNLGMKQALYYYEVMTGVQSQNFQATDYLNISSVIEVKHKSCFAHVSQKIKETYSNDHARMEIFRGMEADCEYAEAFIKHAKSKSSSLFNHH